MPALGCLIPFVLLLAGMAAGWAIGGRHDAFLGAVAGAAIGVAAILALLWWWGRLRERAE